jgi:hypothetical protein
MKYDGLGHFVINFCLEMLEICLNEKGTNKLKHVDLVNYPVLAKLKLEDKLDISLLVLSIIKDYLKHFPNQK